MLRWNVGHVFYMLTEIIQIYVWCECTLQSLFCKYKHDNNVFFRKFVVDQTHYSRYMK